MFSEFINQHPNFAKILLVLFIFAAGWFDQLLFKRKDLACAAWFFGLLVGSVSIISFEGLGFSRWIIAPLVMLVGLIFIIRYYKKSGRNPPRF
jgi:hypothetical protein